MYRVSGSGFQAQGLGFRVSGSGLGFKGWWKVNLFRICLRRGSDEGVQVFCKDI